MEDFITHETIKPIVTLVIYHSSLKQVLNKKYLSFLSNYEYIVNYLFLTCDMYEVKVDKRDGPYKAEIIYGGRHLKNWNFDPFKFFQINYL